MQFVCDFCQASVGLRDKVCPVCNTAFSRVRCPSCKFGGEPREFKNGCPLCGYMDDVFISGKKSRFNILNLLKQAGSIFDKRIAIFIALLLLINVLLFLYAGIY